MVALPLRLLALLALLSFPAIARAQEEPVAPRVEQPLVVVNVAGIERVLTDIDYMFESAQRPELSELVTGFLGNANDLKGMDRDKPFGVMLFLGQGLTPRPVPVAYLPVSDIDDLMETLAQGPITTKPVEGEENRYEIVGPRRTFQLRVQDDYAFVADKAEVLDREFPAPAKTTQALTNRYDIAAQVNLANVPEGMKTLFLDFLRAGAEAELQQRDGEPEPQYRVRRAQGMANLELIERVLTQGRDFTLGWDTSKTHKAAVLECVLNATDDSQLATWLKDIAARRSQFWPVVSERSPFTFSMSWMLDDAGRKVMTEALNAGEIDFARRLAAASGTGATSPEGEQGVPADGPATRLFKPLKATVAEGHLDFFLQFVGDEPGQFVFIGGARVVDADAFGRAVSEVLTQVQDRPELSAVRLNAESHGDIAFHQVEFKHVREQDRRLYGGNPKLTIGAGQKAVWFTVGGPDALPALKAAIDKVSSAPAVPPTDLPVVPFAITVNTAKWVAMMGHAERPSDRQELAQEAFGPDNDALRVEFRPTDSGARLRVQFDEGFIRFIGLSIARRFDRSQL